MGTPAHPPSDRPSAPLEDHMHPPELGDASGNPQSNHRESHHHSSTEDYGAGGVICVGRALSWSRLTPSFLLFLWGAVMIYYFTSGRIVHYLTGFGGFRLQALICGLLLCVLAAFGLMVGERGSEAEEQGGVGHDHDHGHGTGCSTCAGESHRHDHPEHFAEGDHNHAHHGGGSGGWLAKVMAFLILSVPLAAAALYSPDTYSDEFRINKLNAVTSAGATALGGGGVDLARRAEKARSLPGSPQPAGDSTVPPNPNAFSVQELERLSGGRTPEGHIPLQLIELFYMPAQTRDVQEVVGTQIIETTGQAIKDKQDPTKLRLFRLMMTCCAADARPVSIPLEFTAAPPDWREMGWYKAVGTVEYREINGAQTTVFKASSLTPTKPPRQQMLY